MENNEFPEFVSIEHKDKVALIDPKNKVCLKVSKRIADNIKNQDVRNKILPIWKRQASLQKEMEEKREFITFDILIYIISSNLFNLLF